MKSYSFYRLPYADYYSVIESEEAPKVLSSIKDIGRESGFVACPFLPDKDQPIILIPGTPQTFQTPQTTWNPLKPSETPESSPTPAYAEAFRRFHEAVSGGLFHKLVLARRESVETGVGTTEKELFLRTCTEYPRMTVMLFSTPLTGTWLIATPEVLVESDGTGLFHTMALAGTMPFHNGFPEWSHKNREEQLVVEKYIEDTIAPYARDIVKDGPSSSRAGGLMHLRTDFWFHLRDNVSLGCLLSSLHPTPAVCGLPKQTALEFIHNNEKLDRRYYSGFAGPVDISGETHLYVSLRCAELHLSLATLYSGGGIMPDSLCGSEWKETLQKMKTIKDVL